jgi:hypothetical protein
VWPTGTAVCGRSAGQPLCSPLAVPVRLHVVARLYEEAEGHPCQLGVVLDQELPGRRPGDPVTIVVAFAGLVVPGIERWVRDFGHAHW